MTARGAVVVVLSDGWERGDPELLADRMRRLDRLAHRVIWADAPQGTPRSRAWPSGRRPRCRAWTRSSRAQPGRAGASGGGGERGRRCGTSSRC
ncbi:VWA domain-containing protein [Streptomyces sp. NRRL B-24085]|uniref:VWA domain-containing protein n=1 Tax=Streptomyces sp. NRRL B-24085 TaxID=1709476 RepID=UPI001F30967A|nr:VWA domain-containing protein [Streptomyces sp. NRRL B-24085]